MIRQTLSKGEATQRVILDAGIQLAREIGVTGLTIGALADRVQMSKSGLFAHFGSKEELQLAVIKAAQERFVEQVVRPAFAEPRGLARIRALLKGWVGWGADVEASGGCLILAAAAEFDDRPGIVHDHLVREQKSWFASLARATEIAIETGELSPEVDTSQFAFELFGLVLSAHHHARLLGDASACNRALAGLERLIDACSVKSHPDRP
ncbi:TetR/AcrR family transcriptional regulator [Parachitinimonas caeni]|uniref:TetR/AcrR family transcriptional regulator n=1 Tax=Parachitinimonas caeni TaxID=3031301 RepID=A0ABT7E427_9NEIS|nr:TetR/AcrR family transcriptional regulator [Parachitinimonas caeni]MDK2126160.1 TetR/AcrR family transcriptional regulator [Parachitinimonas caeni]